jgi:hypothetical protein
MQTRQTVIATARETGVSKTRKVELSYCACKGSENISYKTMPVLDKALSSLERTLYRD